MARPAIPRELERRILMEAGHRCAISTCKQTPTELAHIVPWSRVHEHRFENLIALCPTCHTRFDRGEIDLPAMRRYKAQLAVADRPGRPALAGSWLPAAPMQAARSYHAAVLIASGVLVIGGDVSGQSTECYDPGTDAWRRAAPLRHARRQASATVLRDGRVLMVGGCDLGGEGVVPIEVYDPQGDAWETVGRLRDTRYAHCATLLPDGRVAITGGYHDLIRDNRPLHSTEIFSVTAGTLERGPRMLEARAGHTAHWLDERLIVVGGDAGHGALATAEQLPLDGGAWEPLARPVCLRCGHAAAVCGRRLIIAGGIGTPDPDGEPTHALQAVEAYDPDYGDWTELPPLGIPRSGFTLTACDEADALLVGGTGAQGNYIWSSAEYLHGMPPQVSAAGRMREPRSGHTAVRLESEAVVVAGGQNLRGSLASVELFIPVPFEGRDKEQG